MVYKDLCNVPLTELYLGFWKVFGDYRLQFTMTQEQFEALLKRSSFCSEYSFGAFDDGKLVGIFLNGCRTKGSEKKIYGIAAGIIPEYRNKKCLSLSWFNYCFEALKTMGSSYFKCEILRDNRPALGYMKRFRGYPHKNLVNYRTEKSLLRQFNVPFEGLALQIENSFNFLKKCKFENDELTWQNTTEAIDEILQDFLIISIMFNGEFIGFGVINILQGDIPLLFITEEYRHKKIGSWLVYELAKRTQSNYVSFYGIDESGYLLNYFINKNGFDIYSKDYEIIKTF